MRGEERSQEERRGRACLLVCLSACHTPLSTLSSPVLPALFSCSTLSPSAFLSPLSFLCFQQLLSALVLCSFYSQSLSSIPHLSSSFPTQTQFARRRNSHATQTQMQFACNTNAIRTQTSATQTNTIHMQTNAIRKQTNPNTTSTQTKTCSTNAICTQASTPQTNTIRTQTNMH